MLLCLQDFPTQYDPPLWRALAKRGAFPVTVWYGKGTPPRDQEIERTAHWSGVSSTNVDVVPTRELRARLDGLSSRPRAILVTGWKQPATLIALAWARVCSVPVILSSDKTWNEASHLGLMGVAYTMAHAVKARLFSGAMTSGVLGRQQLVSVGIPHERIAEGLYPIDIKFWDARSSALADEAARIRQSLASTGPVVLAVCKLSQREDPLFLLEGFARFVRARPTAHLLQVGDGPLRARYEARAKELGVETKVTVAGYVAYDRLAAYYRAADIFVHAPQREPWGISVLEAMACGCPVVATTTVGAAADLVVPGVTGALAYYRDVDSLAGALESVVALGCKALGELARERVGRFDVHAVAEDVVALVREVSENEPARPPPAAVLRSELFNVFGRWSP